MLSRGLIIMQNGRETVVPNTSATRKFWEDYNTNIQRSKIAHKRYVTILEADADTIERCLTPPKAIKPSGAVNTNAKAENDALRAELSELKTLMLRMQIAQQPIIAASEIKMPAAEVTAQKEEVFENFD